MAILYLKNPTKQRDTTRNVGVQNSRNGSTDRPDPDGNEYPDLDRIEHDFAQMVANGFNAVRIPHTMPPRHLLDAAQRHGLKVMVGLSAEQYVGYLIDRQKAPNIEDTGGLSAIT